MREILFRGKRLDNGEWTLGMLGQYHEGIKATMVLNHFGAVESVDFMCVDPATVGQYTGLKDKNGKRIFEGDVVRHVNDNPYATPDIIEKGQVYWDEQFCGWRRTSNGAFHRGVVDTYRMSPSCVYEVIGNIHDNQELLGGGEK